MQFSRKSFSNLAALESGDDSMAELQGGGPLSFGEDDGKESQASLDSDAGRRMKRYGHSGHGCSCPVRHAYSHACGLIFDTMVYYVDLCLCRIIFQ